MNSTPLLRRLAFTPLRDLLRLNISGSLDARSHIESLDLPDEAKHLIDRIVIRTRIWRSEKIDVADELASHFREGLASGRSMRDLIERFGDERAAAQLIRRAKRRERSWFWHVRHRAMQAMGVLIVVYAGLIAYFLSGEAVIKVDYVAKLNAPFLTTPEDQRAWPLYRAALTELGLMRKADGTDALPGLGDAIHASPGEPGWREGEAFRRANRAGIEKLYHASTLPKLAFPVTERLDELTLPQSDDDTQSALPPSLAGSVMALQLHQLLPTRAVIQVLYGDAIDAGLRGDAAGLIRAVEAIERVSLQLREAPFLISQLVALGGRSLSVRAVGSALQFHADRPFLTDADLLRLARDISAGNVPADLIDFEGEKMLMLDMVQRLYTDDGTGNGRIASDGIDAMLQLASSSQQVPWGRGYELRKALTGPLAMLFMPSRRELVDRYMKQLEEVEAIGARRSTLDERISLDERLDESLSRRYALVDAIMPSLNRVHRSGLEFLAFRDATLAAIAIERYRQASSVLPKSLDELVPQYLSAVPIDPIDGEPLRLRIVDDRPVIYSVGIDRDDDNGLPPSTRFGRDRTDLGGDPDRPSNGDWILFPLVPNW
jgi:hypothetical protein